MQVTPMSHLTVVAFNKTEFVHSANNRLPISIWVRSVYDIAITLFNTKYPDSRKRTSVEIRRMIKYVTCKKFHGLGINHGYIPLKIIGTHIANAEGRARIYDHATTINAIKQHVLAFDNRNKGYEEYCHNYEMLEAILINRNYITKDELNGKHKHTYHRG